MLSAASLIPASEAVSHHVSAEYPFLSNQGVTVLVQSMAQSESLLALPPS